jgi:hypothetical protein
MAAPTTTSRAAAAWLPAHVPADLTAEGFVALCGLVGLAAPGAPDDTERAAAVDAIAAREALFRMTTGALAAVKQASTMAQLSAAARGVLIAEVIVDLITFTSDGRFSQVDLSNLEDDVRAVQNMLDDAIGAKVNRRIIFEAPPSTPHEERETVDHYLSRFTALLRLHGNDATTGSLLQMWAAMADWRRATFAIRAASTAQELVLHVPFYVARQAWLATVIGDRTGPQQQSRTPLLTTLFEEALEEVNPQSTGEPEWWNENLAARRLYDVLAALIQCAPHPLEETFTMDLQEDTVDEDEEIDEDEENAIGTDDDAAAAYAVAAVVAFEAGPFALATDAWLRAVPTTIRRAAMKPRGTRTAAATDEDDLVHVVSPVDHTASDQDVADDFTGWAADSARIAAEVAPLLAQKRRADVTLVAAMAAIVAVSPEAQCVVAAAGAESIVPPSSHTPYDNDHGFVSPHGLPHPNLMYATLSVAAVQRGMLLAALQAVEDSLARTAPRGATFVTGRGDNSGGGALALSVPEALRQAMYWWCALSPVTLSIQRLPSEVVAATAHAMAAMLSGDVLSSKAAASRVDQLVPQPVGSSGPAVASAVVHVPSVLDSTLGHLFAMDSSVPSAVVNIDSAMPPAIGSTSLRLNLRSRGHAPALGDLQPAFGQFGNALSNGNSAVKHSLRLALAQPQDADPVGFALSAAAEHASGNAAVETVLESFLGALLTVLATDAVQRVTGESDGGHVARLPWPRGWSGDTAMRVARAAPRELLGDLALAVLECDPARLVGGRDEHRAVEVARRWLWIAE